MWDGPRLALRLAVGRHHEYLDQRAATPAPSSTEFGTFPRYAAAPASNKKPDWPDFLGCYLAELERNPYASHSRIRQNEMTAALAFAVVGQVLDLSLIEQALHRGLELAGRNAPIHLGEPLGYVVRS
jgi:hypothetical protein